MIRKLEMVEQSTVQFGGEKYRNIFISGKPQITDSPMLWKLKMKRNWTEIRDKFNL